LVIVSHRDRKPVFTTFEHSGRTVPTQLIRTLWLGRLPAQIQAILATRTEDRLEDVAKQADRIYEIRTKSVVAATAPSIPHESLQAQPSTTQAAASSQIMMLTQQMAALTMQMTKLTQEWKREKARNRARSSDGRCGIFVRILLLTCS